MGARPARQHRPHRRRSPADLPGGATNSVPSSHAGAVCSFGSALGSAPGGHRPEPCRGAFLTFPPSEAFRKTWKGPVPDVLRRDAPAMAGGAAQNLQRVEQRQQQAAQPGFVRRTLHGLARDADGGSFVVRLRHHHVGGAVGFPEAIHAREGRVVETGQQAGLADEGPEVQGVASQVRRPRGYASSGCRGRCRRLEHSLRAWPPACSRN